MARGATHWGVALVAASLLGGSMGCSEIRLKTVDTQERVLSSRREVVPAAAVNARARMDGTTLLLEAVQGCKVVERQEVEVVEERGADEDLIEEFIVLGIALVPLSTGVVLLADAPNVYEDDRNQRTYNPIGKDGAYVAGTVLTGLGGLLALVPIIELLRVASAGDTVKSVTTRDGEPMAEGVACDGPPNPIRTSVSLRIGGANLATPGTDRDGLMRLDLARALPPELVRRAVVIQVIVGEQVVAEIDPRPIAEAQARGQQMATEPEVPEPVPEEAPEGMPEAGPEASDQPDGKGGTP